MILHLILILILFGCVAPAPRTPASPLVAPVSAAPAAIPAARTPPGGTVTHVQGAAAIGLPAASPTRPSPGQLGMLVFVRAGSIWVMDLPDGQPRQVTHTGNDGQPVWSPTGRWLAYAYGSLLWVVRDDGSQGHAIDGCRYARGGRLWAPTTDEMLCYTTGGGLAIVQADGSGRQEVVPPAASGQDGGVGEAVWSPDGKVLAYDRLDITTPGTPPERVSSLWRVNADGTGAAELANAGTPSRDGLMVASWSPDGSHVLYRVDLYFSGSFLADGAVLWSVPAAGGAPVQIGGNLATADRPDPISVLTYPDFLAWPPRVSAAGNELAATFGAYRGAWTNKRIGRADLTTGQVKLLSPADMAATSASWSPDGRYLAYSAMPDTGDLVGGDTAQQGMMARRIYVVNSQGDPQPRPLTNDPAYRDELPLWSADGQQILFARFDLQSRASLWLAPATGGEAQQVVADLPVDPQTSWFGYYGHIDWQSKFDWWRGPAGRSALGSSPTPPAGTRLAPGTGLVLACHEILPGMPGCLREGSLVGGQLALVETRPAFSGRPAILDLARGAYVILGQAPARLLGWSPSGKYLLTAQDGDNSVASTVYQPDGAVVKSYPGLPATPHWLPADPLPGVADWLSVPGVDGSLSLEPLPEGHMQPVLDAGRLGPGGHATVIWSSERRLAWLLTTDQLAELGSPVEQLHVQAADGNGHASTWTLSQDVRQTYYQLLEWAPGTRLILATKGQAANSLWSWGVPLVTINADTGQVSDLSVSALPSPESHAWNPTLPGPLAVAAGSSRYLFDPSQLTLLDVKTGQRQELTPEGLAVFEPTWSPDGKLLAYAAVPATPHASGDGAALERTLKGRAIYVVDPASGQSRKLTAPGDALDGWPQWAADGQKLLYARIQDGRAEVHVIALNGTGDAILLTGLPAGNCYYGGCGWGRMLAYSPGAPPAALQVPGTTTPRPTGAATPAATIPAATGPSATPFVGDGAAATRAAVNAARLLLSNHGVINPDAVTLIDATPTTWPDDCLGLPSGLTCHALQTPGYLIELEKAGGRYLVRTDHDGKRARLAASPVKPLADAFLRWHYADASVCRDAQVNLKEIHYRNCGEAMLSAALGESMGVDLKGKTPAQYLHQAFAPFAASTLRGTLVFTGTGSVVASTAEQRAIAEWAAARWYQADIYHVSAVTGQQMFWFEESASVCGGLWIYQTGLAAAWDCPGQKVVGAGFLTAPQMWQFYNWLDSGQQWVISRTIPAATGQPGRGNLDFATNEPDRSRTSEGEEDLVQFARAVYEELTDSLTQAGNNPAATATPAAQASPTPDLGQTEIRQWVSTSPDRQWVAQVLAAFPPSQGSDYYTRLTVRKPDGTAGWQIVDSWQRLALGYTTPQPFQWSRDGRFLYFTDVPVPDGCAVFVNGSDLQRVELASARVEQIVPPVGLWLSLSPDEKTLAYIGEQGRGLVLRDLASGQERQIALNSQTPGAQLGGIVWAPEGGALVLAVAPTPCERAWTARSLDRVDLPGGTQTTLLTDEGRGFTSIAWPEPDRVELRDKDGQRWWLNAITGGLSPADTPGSTPTPGATGQPAALRTYTSSGLMVSLDYPADWQPIQGYGERYGGPGGFFQVTAGHPPGCREPALEEACDLEAHHHLQPYGSQPAIVPRQVQGQPAYVVLPSADQPAEMAGQAALEAQYPQPVTIDGTAYVHFILYADQDHIEQLARSLRFLSPAGNAATATPTTAAGESFAVYLITEGLSVRM